MMNTKRRGLSALPFLTAAYLLGSAGCQPAGLKAKPYSEDGSATISPKDGGINDMVSDASTECHIMFEWFNDFAEPFGARFYRDTFPRIKANYGQRMMTIMKHFPLVSVYPDAPKAAEASECARDQNQFWAYADVLFTNQGNGVAIQNLRQYADQARLDRSLFDPCLDNGVKSSLVKTNLEEGIARGVGGVPTFYINGRQVLGAVPYEQFQPELERACH